MIWPLAPAETLRMGRRGSPNCFLRMLNSPAQQRSRAARRQKDADRERFNNVLNAVAIGAAAFAVTLLVICFVL